MIKFIKILSVSTFIGFMPFLPFASTLPLPLSEKTSVFSDSNSLDIKYLYAKSAFASGFYQISETLYSELLENPALPPSIRSSATLDFINLLIKLKKPQKAQVYLDSLPNQKSPEVILRKAMIIIEKEQFGEAEDLLDDLSPNSLSISDAPWYYLSKGIAAQKNRDFKDSEKALLHLKSMNAPDHLKVTADSLLFFAEIFSGKPTESLARSLEKKVNNPKKPVEVAVYKQLAIVFSLLDRQSEALEILDRKLENLSPNEAPEKDALLLTKALISPQGSKEALDSLRSILERRDNKEIMKMALALLFESEKANDASFYSFINKIYNSPQGHPLMDHLLALRMQYALKVSDSASAAADANILIENFPASPVKKQALATLAFLAWNENPPKYRYVASLLNDVRALCADPQESSSIAYLMADSYFLNQDFSNAAALYAELLQSAPSHLPLGTILFQLVLSEINQNHLVAAISALDTYRSLPGVSSQDLWKAEWNLISAMKAAGEVNSAVDRLNRLIASDSDPSISPELRLRLTWLRAQLALETGHPENVPRLADSVLELLKKQKTEDVDSQQIEILAGNTLLLKAQALLDTNKLEDALLVLKTLRQAYPHTHSAVLSYIAEARYYASHNRTVEAQQKLINLSDVYPDSEFAPVALYEAALNAENRDLHHTYQEALSLLERLCLDFPNSPLVFHARLEQGDILRKINDFGAAQLVYENILYRFPEHPERYKVELARADSLLAQAAKNPSLYSDAIDSYERLFDVSSIPTDVRIESGFKCGFALAESNKVLRAEEAYWSVLSQFLIQSSPDSLSPHARYWLSRSALELANLFELQQNTAEAKKAYELILQFQLPGKTTANNKLHASL